MSLTEKAAYLRGLYDGLGLKENTSAEGRLLSAMIDVLEEMAGHVSENEESITSLADQVDDLNEAMDELNDLFADGLDDLDEEGLDYEDEADDDITEFEVECPKCAAPIVIDQETLEGGEVVCSSCGQRFSIDVGYEDVEDEDAQPF